MKSSNHTVLLDDPYCDPKGGGYLEFRLTYDGLLLGASKVNTRAEHKHEIRRAFHPQLRRLWTVLPQLEREFGSMPPMRILVNEIPPPPPKNSERLAQKFAYGGFRFVPLVTQELTLACSIEILFLRPDSPGGAVINSGDLDNRLKTLFDALRVPSPGEMNPKLTPQDDEDPFYCLLEDDRLITKVSVETDLLLQPVGNKRNQYDPNDARLIITVRLRPAEFRYDNSVFG